MMHHVGHARKWCEACNEGQVAQQVKHRYGLDPRDYHAMVERQGNLCAICRLPCLSRKRLSVDHDHDSGVIRGLLCNDCNTTLGKFGDDPERFRRAAAYLEANMG